MTSAVREQVKRPGDWKEFFDGPTGDVMYAFARELWPICRSLTGDGVRKTLSLIRDRLPQLQTTEVPTGTKCFDWEVPNEWNIESATLIGPDGKKVVDFADNNLHVVGYSEPVEVELSLEDLNKHLYSLPEQPEAIPYVTSYYKRNWGFCLTHRQRQSLKPGTYRAVIRSRLEPGHLTYAELVLPGKTDEEVLFSTYVCHPSVANNELSGPVAMTALAQWIQSLPERRFTYRFYFGPETIGAVVYLQRYLDLFKRKMKAGFVATCVGDDRAYSYLPSRKGNTLADRVAVHALKQLVGEFKTYSYLDRGSDERQYCSPGADLPVASIMRTKYWEYPEYHTSLDDLSVISPKGLAGALAVYKACVYILENNRRYRTSMPGEPQLGKRGLYPNTSIKGQYADVKTTMNFVGFADGERDLLDLSSVIHADFLQLARLAATFETAGVVREVR